MLRDKNKSVIISYIALRQFIGYCGIAVPFVCVLGGLLFAGLGCQQSISHYYHTNMRDFFVGLLFCISFFLFTYKGYEKIDRLVNIITAISGMGVAIMPCLVHEGSTDRVGILQIDPAVSNALHLSCAALFFLLLAFNSYFLFTLSKHEKENWTDRKHTRNTVYRLCGIIMVGSLLIYVVLRLVLGKEVVNQYRILLVIETVMMWSFGFSWLVKGKAILADNLDEGSGD